MGRLKTWVGNKLLQLLADTQPEASRIQLAGVTPDQAQYATGPSFLSMLRQGYRKNAAFKACVEVIATATGEAPLRVYSEADQEIPRHPTRRLMRRPNPFLSEAQLWEVTSTHYDMVGNAFWHKARAASGQVVELWPLRPDRVKIVAHPDKFIVGYLYSVGSATDIPIPVKDMVHFPALRLGDDFFGEPPFLAGLRALDTDNEAVDFVKAILQNGAVPGHFIETEATTLDPTTQKILEAKWEEKFGGERRGKPLFGTKGMKVTRVGLNMQELVLDGIRGLTIADICTAMRVPPILIAAKVGLDAGTYANFEISRLVLHDDRIAPRHRLFADIIDGDPDLGDGPDSGITLRFDLTDVPAVQPRILKRREAARLDYQAGLLMKDEARAEGGFPPVGGEDGGAFREPQSPLLGFGDPAVQDLLRRAAGAPGPRSRRKVEPVDLLEGPLGKVDFAETYLGRLARQARKTFARQAAEVLDEWKDRTRADDLSVLVDQLLQAVLGKQATWSSAAKGDFLPLLRKVVAGAADLAARELAAGKPDFSIPADKVDAFVDEYTYRFAEKISATSVERVRQVLQEAQSGELTVNGVAKALRSEFRDWDQSRSVMVARTETIRAANEGARMTYEEAGIEEMEWLAADDACPICLTLNGRKVRVAEGFLKMGETLALDDEEDGTFTPSYEAVTAPPAHPHCRCTIVPVVVL